MQSQVRFIHERLRVATSYAIEICARAAEFHPFLWKLAWEAVHTLRFLLPHDKSYNALRHFIKIKPTGLFLDIGANDGISTLSFRRFNKRYQILGFEPNPLLENALNKIKKSDPYFDFKMVAASSTPGHINFFVPIFRGIVLHTFTSSSKAQVVSAVARSFGQPVADSLQIKEFRREVIRLDDLHLEPTIVKVDAEGFDYEVLIGLIKTIRISRCFIVTEIASGEFEKIRIFFDELQYTLLIYDIFHDRFHAEIPSYPSAVKAMSGHRNFFAVPNELMEQLPFSSGKQP
jgi:FkbM family methyltransferase